MRNSRTHRITATAIGLGVSALVLAPGAAAETYKDVAPKPDTQVLAVTASRPTPPAPTAAPEALAFTGVEVGTVGALGLGLVAGGALLVRGSRRRGVTA